MDYEQKIGSAISAESFCGVNLEDDSGFQNFFFSAEGTPERYDGQKSIPAEPPDWRIIKKQALEYLEKTKDLKLISVLMESVISTEGVLKFEQCLRGLSALINEQWETVYPALDEDDGDPLERISALGHLNSGFVINALKNMPLASSKVLGHANIINIDKALSGSGDSPFTASQIQGIFSEASAEDSLALHVSMSQCLSHFNDISQCFTDRAGHEYTVSFDATVAILKQVILVLEKHANIAVVAEPTSDDTDSEGESMDNPQQATAETQQNKSFSNGGKLQSRADVEKCLSLILDYYSAHEPSSPIPILINRANNLVHLNFLEIMKNIYPDALSTLHQLGGIEDTEG